MILTSKQIKKTAVFTVIFIGLMFGLDFIYQQVYKKEQSTKFGKIFNLQNQKFDYIFLGNSRALINAQVGELNKETSLQGYNLGLDGSNAMHQFLLLHTFLKNKNTCKAIYFNYDPWGVQLRLNNKQRIYGFLPHLSDDSIYTHLRQTFGYRTFLWKYIPMWKFSEFNSRLGFVPFTTIVSKTFKEKINKTGDYVDVSKKIFKPAETNEYEEILIREENISYLKKIAQLCADNHIKLIFYTSPVYFLNYKRYTNIEKINTQVFQQISSVYYNFCDSDICNKLEYFYDRHHLNQAGNKVFTPLLTQMINTTR